MADRVQFELVSPERLLLSQPVEMVVVPGSEGNFGVLPGHSPLISTIRPGMIEIYEGHAVAARFFIAGGIAEVTPERCTVLAEEAGPPESFDRVQIEADLADVRGNLPLMRDELGRAPAGERERLLAELARLERAEAVAVAKLRALSEAGR